MRVYLYVVMAIVSAAASLNWGANQGIVDPSRTQDWQCESIKVTQLQGQSGCGSMVSVVNIYVAAWSYAPCIEPDRVFAEVLSASGNVLQWKLLEQTDIGEWSGYMTCVTMTGQPVMIRFDAGYGEIDSVAAYATGCGDTC